MNTVASIQKYCPLLHEILLLECGAEPKPELFPGVRYFHDGKNYGFAGGFNYLGGQVHTDSDVFVMSNEDMFYGPNCILPLISALSEPNVGMTCCNLTNGGLYDKKNPQLADVNDFEDRNKSPLEHRIGHGSNPPWAITKGLWKELSEVDVWNNARLPENKNAGALDEGIDPFNVGWTADWDLFNRVLSLGLRTVIINNAVAYHYDHCSGGELDASTQGWTQYAVQNYILKYGSFAKDLPVVKKPKPNCWPLRPSILDPAQDTLL